MPENGSPAGTQMGTESGKAPKRTLSQLVEQFWFLRGVVAAVSICELIPKFTSLERFDFLKAFHAVLVGWNQLAAWLGDVLGRLPFLPHLSADQVNAAAFVLAFGVPVAYFANFRVLARPAPKSPWDNEPPSGRRNRTRRRRTDQVDDLFIGVGAVSGTVSILLVFAFLYTFLRAPIEVLAKESLLRMVFDCLVFGGVIVCWILAAWHMPGYKRGLVWTATFIATLQVLYWLNTPWLKDRVNALANSGVVATSAPAQADAPRPKKQ